MACESGCGVASPCSSEAAASLSNSAFTLIGTGPPAAAAAAAAAAAEAPVFCRFAAGGCINFDSAALPSAVANFGLICGGVSIFGVIVAVVAAAAVDGVGTRESTF